MSRIPDEVIDQVRDATDVIALIGESVDLKRTGSDWRGPCPFHGGTHRNFAVIPRKGLFYCYVCHEKGDAFSYLMKRFGMDYPTAVRELARRAGIVVPERTERAGPDPHEPLYGAVATAQDWFARRLLEAPDAAAAREYLVARDVPLEQAAPHGLGWAPQGPAFLEAMRGLGVAEEVLLATGLAIRLEDGRVIPRFRNRLLFPIHDLRGRVVGFGGRLLGPGEPKYLNSSETPIFSKGRLLYNLHHAKNAIRQEQVVLVVEGYFDVLRLVLAGVDHVVAPLGTAMTPEQAALVRRVAPAAVLLYDSDLAGLRATFRAGDELLRHGVRVRVATMPPGEDPDTLVQRGGAAALEPVLRDAIDVLERKVQVLERRGWFGDVEHRREALDKLLPTVRAAADPITRELYLGLVAERTGVSREVLERELAEPVRGGGPSGPARPAGTVPAPRPPGGPGPGRVEGRPPAALPGSAAERSILALCIAAPEWLERARREIPAAWFGEPRLRELYELLLGGTPPSALAERASEGAARLAERLLAQASAGGVDADQTYADAAQELEAQPLISEYEALRAQARDPARWEEAEARLKRLREELSSRYERPWRKYMLTRRGDRRAPGSTPRRPDAP